MNLALNLHHKEYKFGSNHLVNVVANFDTGSIYITSTAFANSSIEVPMSQYTNFDGNMEDFVVSLAKSEHDVELTNLSCYNIGFGKPPT